MWGFYMKNCKNNFFVIDVGNTNIRAAKISKGKISKRFLINRKTLKIIPSKCDVIIASVSKANLKSFLPYLKKNKCRIYIVGKDIKVPMVSHYNKKQIGQDRLVTAYAAKKEFKPPLLIIDFGTAVTFDVISKKGEYLGGVIFPGIKMSIDSLYERTSLLPKIIFKKRKGFIGKSTKDSITNGIVIGYGEMCENIVIKLKKRFKSLRVVATGGDASIISEYASSIKNIDHNLSLKGLARLFLGN